MSEVKSRSACAEFSDRLKNIQQRGKAVGLNLTDICRRVGCSRATPDRWKAKPPQTLVLIDKMEAAVAAAERAAAKANS